MQNYYLAVVGGNAAAWDSIYTWLSTERVCMA